MESDLVVGRGVLDAPCVLPFSARVLHAATWRRPVSAGLKGESLIVGYQTKELASGNFTMLNVPFVNPSDATKGLQLNSDITVENVTASEDDTTAADQIWVWVAADNGYRRFFRYAGEGDYRAGWCEAQGVWPYIEETEGFGNGITSGTAMFYKAKKGDGKAAVFTSPLVTE